MTGAELKTLREALGLPVPYLAQKAGVKDRSVNYWESDTFKVPATVADFLNGMDSVLEKQANNVAFYTKGVDFVVLVRYRNDKDLWKYQPRFFGDLKLPAAAHAALLNRIKIKLKQKNIETGMVYFDEDAYSEWMKQTRKTNSLDNRALWAATVYSKREHEKN